jgi:methionyl-tRNA formyltransferase
MQPWPTAYTFLHRQGNPPLRIIVNKAGVLDHLPPEEGGDQSLPHVRPGAVLRTAQRTNLWVAAGHGYLLLSEIQPASKRRMAAFEFLRGHPLQPGDYFGPEAS